MDNEQRLGIEPVQSSNRANRQYRPLSTNANVEIDSDRDVLNFQESDPTFRIFICNYPVIPVFVVISIVKLFLLLAALLFTIAQLISYSSTSRDEFLNSTSSISNKGPRRVNVDKPSWAAAIFYFEPSWWLVLAYVRLFVAVIAIISVGCGLCGVWRQNGRLMSATVATDCGLVLFLLCYMALLAWHAVKYDDYFGFCIGGLTLLGLLLICVMGLHAAVISQKYIRSITAFLLAAKRRWPERYDGAIRAVQRQHAERRGCFMKFYNQLTKRYAIVKELCHVAATELTAINRCRMVLHDIEEVESEEHEEQRAV